MIDMAIGILWLLIGVIVLCGVIYLALLVVKLFVDIPPRLEQGVWLIVLILILIAALTLLAGRGIKGVRLSDDDGRLGYTAEVANIPPPRTQVIKP